MRDQTHRYHCDSCNLTIGKKRNHWLFGKRVLCPSCVGTPEGHEAIAPTCAESWHDAYDHPHQIASYAAAIRLIGSPCKLKH